MKTRNIIKQFSTEVDLGYRTLVVGGCSFTYNNSETAAVTWPYYLRDLAGFTEVYDTSLPGAGNYHICNSIIWTLENLQCPIDTTLVIVMVSGNNRDDAIVSRQALNDYPVQFNYNDSVAAGISGGNDSASNGNDPNVKTIDKSKSIQSRSVENYLYVTDLYNYLSQHKYKFHIFNYLDVSIPNLANDFDVTEILPQKLRRKYKNFFEYDIENLYRFAVRRDLLSDDDFHPSPDGHLLWTRDCLLPFLISGKSHADTIS